MLEGRGCERHDKRAPNGPIRRVSLRRCKRTPKPYPFGYGFGVPRMGEGQGGSRHVKHTISACLTCLGREGRCRTAQMRPFWCVCAVQERVCRYEDEVGARRGGRGIETRQTRRIGVFDMSQREGRCRTPKTHCFGRIFGVQHERGHRTQMTRLPGRVLRILEGAWL